MAKYIEKISNALKIVKHNGGIVGTYLGLYRRDDFKWGTFVGEDKYGNKYYKNDYFFMGKSRWVEYPLSVGHDYDASQIPSEWHRWLQYIADEPPTQLPLPHRPWMADHTENFSGTSREYVPYSTTRPKVEAWVPPKK
ncbi:probable NADH dehydrogenase [ubiquinone] 1 alpha subcomplex subunit 12 [Aplysia californica]|uniref:NADH dehydrogenase [ubiquinone] 1 alpha subcomplex subunit 12 n=1 Tax=Aplysia californica TaxID=6500 RepID=A0ABM0JF32_APLCA|nr:probable NADH dehydrogenase [ubiquinone] 1 alpha subcomplex subunit 12 [Aplysia californica]